MPQPARALDVRPSPRVAATNGRSDLRLPKFLDGRKVNAPEMSSFVPFQRLQNKARRHAMSYARLHNLLRAQMIRQAPDRPHESRISVIPGPETLRTGPNPFCLQLSHHFGP